MKDKILDLLEKLSDNPSDSKISEIIDLISNNLYDKDDMIESAKYGYEYHINTSFPNKSFEDNCKNNFLQHLWSKNRNYEN